MRRLFSGFGGVGYYRGSPEAIDHRYCQMSETPFNELGGHDLLASHAPAYRAAHLQPRSRHII